MINKEFLNKIAKCMITLIKKEDCIYDFDMETCVEAFKNIFLDIFRNKNNILKQEELIVYASSITNEDMFYILDKIHRTESFYLSHAWMIKLEKSLNYKTISKIVEEIHNEINRAITSEENLETKFNAS